ncbi:MAG TPA: glycosyltransferase [Polyangiaceae bacterium]|nr:glycosyltransferase [Polyangiaceae bacterium]
MNKPLVSVHIVTYQQRDLIAETLESVLQQDYAPLQIVVSDDGSTDGTADVVEDYARRYPDKIIAITGGPNLGISGNSNRCLRRCTGELIAFLAGDDLMLPGKIAAQVAWFQADSARVLCAHDVEHFDSASGRTLRLHSSITAPRSGAGVGEFLGRGYFSATSSIMVRASSLPSYGFDERIRVHSDWKLAADCLVGGGKFGYVPGVLGRYRRHDRNATSVFSNLRWVERHVGLGILEAEHPELMAACELARAYAYLQRAVALVQAGQGHEARLAFRNAVAHSPTVSWKLPAWWALSFVPSSLLPRRLRGGTGA